MDGIAYALDENSIPVKNAYDPNSWPKNSITWMIGGFTNSKAHRINNEAYLTKERTHHLAFGSPFTSWRQSRL